nr:hypothetical protein [Micromonospora tarapacensis]
MSAPQGVAVSGGGQDDVHATVVRVIEPAQIDVTDKDIADDVVGYVA